MEIHHIGYLVKEISGAIIEFEKLGYILSKRPFYDEVRDADICFVQMDRYCVEIIAPKKTSSLHDMLKHYKNTAYHICYKVESIGETIDKLKKEGYVVFKEKQKAPAIAENADVAFLMGRIGMIELLEFNKRRNEI